MWSYDLIKNKIAELTGRNGKNSISKADVFGVMTEMVNRQQSAELTMSNLTIRKIYASVAAMNADAAAPVGDDGENIRRGQLVAIQNAADATEMGKVYRYTVSAWEYVCKIGDVSIKTDSIQKKDARNIKINGAVCSLQRWASVTGQFFKIMFPNSNVGLNNGVSYIFDITIRRLALDTTSKNSYLKLRVELFRTSTNLYNPNITYIAGNTSIIDSVKLYYEMDLGNSFRIPSVIIDSSYNLTGIVVDNLTVSTYSNSSFTSTETTFTTSEIASVSGLTLLYDYTSVLSSANLPITLNGVSSLFLKVDSAPSKTYDYTGFISQVDPETGSSNTFYRTIYKRAVNGETRITAKVWGSSTGQKLFRAFNSSGVLISSYSRDVQSGEPGTVVALDITLGSDVYYYSVSFVVVSGSTPDVSNAKLTILYTNIGSFITAIIQSQIDQINAKIANSTKYIDFKGVGTALSKFLTLINIDHNKPLNLLFIGDSIVNFQNAWNNGETPVYFNKPLCMYNPNTFTNRIWELLNPGALYYDKTAKTYGGAMTFLKSNATPGDLTPSSGVVINGSWLSNITGSAYNNLGDCGGYPGSGWHEFLFSRTQGNYIEFSVPAGILGFAIIAECSTSLRSSDGVNSYGHSTSAEVYFNGVLQGTINTGNINGNVRFDFTFANATSGAGTVKVLLTEVNKWLGLWGVETWNSKRAVRPINNGLASHSVKDVYNKYERAVTSASPDFIVIEAMLNNDSGLTESEVRQYYELMWTNLAILDKPIIAITPHWGTYNRMIYNASDMNHDDPRHVYNAGTWNPKGYHPSYLRIFLNWCRSHNIPVINVCQYMYDNYGDDSTPFLLDSAHLNVAGHALYKGMIDVAFTGNY